MNHLANFLEEAQFQSADAFGEEDLALVSEALQLHSDLGRKVYNLDLEKVCVNQKQNRLKKSMKKFTTDKRVYKQNFVYANMSERELKLFCIAIYWKLKNLENSKNIFKERTKIKEIVEEFATKLCISAKDCANATKLILAKLNQDVVAL